MHDKFISVFSLLGQRLVEALSSGELGPIIARAVTQNSWFTEFDIIYQIKTICSQMLDAYKLDEWLNNCPVSECEKKVLVIMAGNIPLVGFFDLLCVLAGGHMAVVKTSSKDSILMKYVIDILKNISPDIPIKYYDGSENVDALIAMGGDNAVRFFRERYEGIPMLLRGSRYSVAVLDGTETEAEIAGLATDITAYSGLGCRNVGLLFLPVGYDVTRIINSICSVEHINKKIINNYGQRKALLTMAGRDFSDCGSRILFESSTFPEAISQVNYYFYDSQADVAEWLVANDESIQCVVGHMAHRRGVNFGQSQSPSLTDYPDGVDTMQFLSDI